MMESTQLSVNTAMIKTIWLSGQRIMRIGSEEAARKESLLRPLASTCLKKTIVRMMMQR